MPEPVLVGVDIGTSAVKACTWRLTDARYRSARRLVGVDCRGDQAPDDVWRAVAECLREVLGDADGQRVLGVSLAGHGPSLVAVDGDSRAASAIITWMDPRPAVAAAGAGAGSAGPSFEATAAWLLRSAASRVYLLQPKDYVILQLTGERCMDASALSCTSWEAGGGAEWLPRAVESWEAVGAVSCQAAADTGLTAGAPVAAGGIDAFVEALGAGIIQPGPACDSTGTSTCISAACAEGAEGAGGGAGSTGSTGSADSGGERAVKHVVSRMKLCVEPVTYSGGALAWAMSTLMPEAGGANADWAALIADVAARTRPGADGLLFIPHMTGPRSEWHGPRASGAFVGLRARHTRFDMIRAVLEGCAYSIRECVERQMPWGVTEFRAVGSGARHDAWLQIKADALSTPVVRMAIQEGALAGAVILAGMAAGVFGGACEGVEAVVRGGRRFEPAPASYEATAAYEAGYREFCDAERGLGR